MAVGRKKRCLYSLLFPVVLMLAPGTSGAVQDAVQVHGFGGWAYARTDGNNYLMGNEDGSYANSYFALNISASPYEKFSANVQTQWRTSRDGLEMEFDYAFAEWAFYDWLKLRIGKVKCPFGIYTEVWDVGTVRPFYTIPQGMYGTPGTMATKSYLGAGLTGSYYLTGDWGLQYDLYGGNLTYPNVTEPDIANYPATRVLELQIDNAVGARLAVQTPLDGLSAGASIYMGEIVVTSGGQVEDYYVSDWHNGYGAHLEYLYDPVSVRAEYGYMHKWNGTDVDIQAAYVEAAYRLFAYLQLAAMYDLKWIDFAMEVPLEGVDEHKDLALGLNYWFNPNLVLKLSYHHVQGNLLAQPDDIIAEMFSPGGLEETTHLVVFGTQFSF